MVAGGKLNALAIKLGWPLLGLVAAIARALWVRLEEPRGIELRRHEAPALFAAVEETRRGLRAPPAHRVVVTDDFNAAVAQRPRLGVLGLQKNHRRWQEAELFGPVLQRATNGQPLTYHRLVAETGG